MIAEIGGHWPGPPGTAAFAPSQQQQQQPAPAGAPEQRAQQTATAKQKRDAMIKAALAKGKDKATAAANGEEPRRGQRNSYRTHQRKLLPVSRRGNAWSLLLSCLRYSIFPLSATLSEMQSHLLILNRGEHRAQSCRG